MVLIVVNKVDYNGIIMVIKDYNGHGDYNY